MDPSPFLSLPTEILQQIGPHLSTADIASLRSTSIRLAHVFIPFLVNVLAIEVSDVIRRAKGGVDYDAPFVATPRTLLPFVKSLVVRFMAAGHKRRASLLPVVREEVVGLASLKHFKLIWSASPSTFKDGEKVVMAAEEEELLHAVFEATRGRLEHLQVHLSFILPRKSPLPPRLLSSFLLLKNLELHIDENHNRGVCFSVAREVLAQSSTLERLSLSGLVNPVNEDHPYTLFIQDLFPSRRTVSHLPLRSLQLNGAIECQQSLSVDDIPSMPYLEDLTIIQYGSTDLDAFWDFLRATKTWLQYLKIEDSIRPAAVRYLTSFQGTREFLIPHIPKSDQGIFAKSMFPILRSQAATLTILSISAPACLWAQYKEAGHPFHTSWPSPSLFTHLRDLRTWCPLKWDFDTETCQDVLTWLEQFPALDHAFIDWNPDRIVAVTDPSLFSRIGNQLVGRTGRPRYWSIEWGYDEWFTWRIQPNSPTEWSFSVLPHDHECNLCWDG